MKQTRTDLRPYDHGFYRHSPVLFGIIWPWFHSGRGLAKDAYRTSGRGHRRAPPT